MKPREKSFVERIALERIYRLFELAGAEFKKHPERSKRYVELAREIGKRNRVKVPGELKESYCRKCNAFLVKGKNAKAVKEKHFLVLECKECGGKRKYPLKDHYDEFLHEIQKERMTALWENKKDKKWGRI
ncbi:MAG: ribonuclease P protein component 4 [Candidatus Diapherotrites archaeon]